MNDRPMPKVSAVSQPFWAACNSGVLMLQRCEVDGCRKFLFYPRVCCPYCGGGSLTWEKVSGRGWIRSFTQVHRPQHESFQDEVPIYFVAIELEEGPLFYSRLSNRPGSNENLMGRAVNVVFVDPGLGQNLPYFALTEECG